MALDSFGVGADEQKTLILYLFLFFLFVYLFIFFDLSVKSSFL